LLPPLQPAEVAIVSEDLNNLWIRGGYPQSYLANSELISFQWRKDFVTTYLERDIPIFGPRISKQAIERLWTMLAHRQGSLLNVSDLARALEVSASSVTRYIDLLTDLLLVRRLEPFHPNVSKRITKASKVYIRDSGILHALLNIDSFESLQGNPIIGMSWEGFVIESILESLPWRANAFFYRTTVGAIIDLIIEFANGSKWAIEIKRSAAAKIKRGFFEAHSDVNPTKAFIVHAGEERYPVAQKVDAIGLIELCQLVKSA